MYLCSGYIINDTFKCPILNCAKTYFSIKILQIEYNVQIMLHIIPISVSKYADSINLRSKMI